MKLSLQLHIRQLQSRRPTQPPHIPRLMAPLRQQAHRQPLEMALGRVDEQLAMAAGEPIMTFHVGERVAVLDDGQALADVGPHAEASRVEETLDLGEHCRQRFAEVGGGVLDGLGEVGVGAALRDQPVEVGVPVDVDDLDLAVGFQESEVAVISERLLLLAVWRMR